MSITVMVNLVVQKYSIDRAILSQLPEPLNTISLRVTFWKKMASIACVELIQYVLSCHSNSLAKNIHETKIRSLLYRYLTLKTSSKETIVCLSHYMSLRRIETVCKETIQCFQDCIQYACLVAFALMWKKVFVPACW